MRKLIFSGVLALAACGPTGDRADADRASGAQAVDVANPSVAAGSLSRGGGKPVAKGAENVVIPANGVAIEEVLPVVRATEPGPVPTSLPSSIPEQFRGRWGLTPADCTSTRGDNKGLLVIGGKDLTFYEAKGRLNRVMAAPAADRFEGSFNLTGEGMTWTRVERFDVKLDTLRRRTDKAPADEPPVDLNYTRCSG